MTNLKTALLFIIFCIYAQCINAQNHLIEESKVIIETSTGKSEVCHETHDHNGTLEHNIALRAGQGNNAAFLRENGLFEIGSVDVCVRTYDPGVFLAVQGEGFKLFDSHFDHVSDQRLKSNITRLEKSTEKFLNLNFYSYDFKAGGPTRYGILAQEVKDDFPHSMGTFTEKDTKYLTFNPNNLFYTGMKVIQENSLTIRNQQQEIKTLQETNQQLQDQIATEKAINQQQQQRLEEIEALLATLGNTSTTQEPKQQPTIETVNIRIEEQENQPQLGQNIPNPFSRFTTIPYYLPTGTETARLIIQDVSGKMIVEQSLPGHSGEGKVEIDLENNQLVGGQFSYSLFANGKLLGTKQMIFVKD